MTSEESVMAALEGAWRVSYPSLLARLRARGEEPCGMFPVLDSLKRSGLIRLLSRQGQPWVGYGDDRGPMYIEVRR